MAGFVTHLESAIDGTKLAADEVQTLHEGRPLWVRYDLDAIRERVNPETIARRSPTMWRYEELLPCSAAEAVTLGEGMTPLLSATRLGSAIGLNDLWIKDESQLPTGSFKSRGLGMAVSMAARFGLRRLAIPTAGNAGGALAAYGARVGAEVFVFMPEDTPVINQIECHLAGAKTFLVNGLINDCGRIVREGVESAGWFDFSTLKEPYRIEGKKTMGLELAEQFGWELPDAILYPTGGGTGLIGMWKAFAELQELGWLRTKKKPRMFAVQSDGCAPIVRAFENGERFAEVFEGAATCAAGIRVPVAVGDFMILDAVRESGGAAVSVCEDDIMGAVSRAISLEGISVCPEAAACVLAAKKLVVDGRLKADERTVIFNTGAVQKYPECAAVDLPRVDVGTAVDYAALTGIA